jgi:hypothetical protein
MVWSMQLNQLMAFGRIERLVPPPAVGRGWACLFVCLLFCGPACLPGALVKGKGRNRAAVRPTFFLGESLTCSRQGRGWCPKPRHIWLLCH